MRRRQRSRVRDKDSNADLLRTAIFSAPLKTSLALTKGTGGPTWSRNTKAWRFNEQGYLREIPSGCAEFGGARLVRNTVRTKSEDFSNAAWTKANLTVTGANVLVCSNSTADNSINQAADISVPTIAGQYFRYSIRAKRVSGGVSFVQIGGSSTSFGATAFCTFSLVDGTYSAQAGVTANVAQISSDTYEFSIRVLCTTTTSDADLFYVSMQNALSDTRKQPFVGDGIKSFELLRAWSVDVTGYDSSYIPDYVSVGSDIGKNFFLHTDDFSQSAWSKTNVTITQAAIANPVNGRVDAQKIEATAGAVTSQHQSVSNCGSTTGNIFTFYVKQGAGETDANRFVIRNNTTATDLLSIRINYSTGAITYVVGSSGVTMTAVGSGWWKVIMVVTSGVSNNDTIWTYIAFAGAAETAGEYCYIYRPYLGRGTTAPEVIPAVAGTWDLHGSGIDGAKYFSTDYTGSRALPSLNGLRKEIAATNNLLWSRNLAGATWTQLGSLPTPKAWVPTTMGSSVVSNGTFDTDLAGWTNNGSATASVVSGKMRIDGTAGTGGRYQDLTLTVGKTYLITGGITSISGSGTLQCVIYATAALSGAVKSQQYTASNTVAIIFTATATTQRIYCSVAASTVADFDDIAVTECSCVATTATGLDGIANTATTLTATSTDAIILQPTSGIASAARCASAYVKRRTGTGTISFTQDGGSTWTDITSLINTSTYYRVQITATLANPSVGFKISTSGDAIEVDCVQNEAGSVATSPIVTTTATVTRNADVLTYQTSGNIDFTVGSSYAMFKSSITSISRYAFHISYTAGSLISTSYQLTSWRAYDGTNFVTATGLDDFTVSMVKRAVAWGGSELKVCGKGLPPTVGAFDGTMGSGAIIDIGFSLDGYIGDVAFYNYKMTDAELQEITK